MSAEREERLYGQGLWPLTLCASFAVAYHCLWKNPPDFVMEFGHAVRTAYFTPPKIQQRCDISPAASGPEAICK